MHNDIDETEVSDSNSSRSYYESDASQDGINIPFVNRCRDGRKFIQINHYKIIRLRCKFHFSWNLIARKLGINKKTLQRWRQRVSFVDQGSFNPRNRFHLAELDRAIRLFLNDHLDNGEKQVISHITSISNLRTTRKSIRDRICLIDPVGLCNRTERMRHRIVRRNYSVPCPHYLWYIDKIEMFLLIFNNVSQT